MISKRIAESCIRDYARKHRIVLLYPDPNPGRNRGGQFRRHVWLGEFDKGDDLLAAFFHEVGHIIDVRREKNRYHDMPILEHELRAWTFGFEEMHGYSFSPTRRMCRYMMEKLNTYNKEEHLWIPT